MFVQLGCPAKVRDASLDNIHAHDRKTLHEKLNEFLNISTSEYFERNELERFRHDYYVNGSIAVPVEDIDARVA